MKLQQLIIGSKGYAYGPAVCVVNADTTDYKQAIKADEVESEVARFVSARAKVIEELQKVITDAQKNLGAKHAEIFEGHLTLFEDEELQNEISEKIKTKLYSAEKATQEFTDETCADMMQLDDYFKERAQDFKDLGGRLIAVLQHGTSQNPIATLLRKSIILAKELTPSMTAQMDVANVLGFVTETGGPTSHVAFIAQNLEIPALVGASGICSAVKDDDTVLINAIDGEVIINPAQTDIIELEQKQQEYKKNFTLLLKRTHESAQTRDGKTIRVYANIGSEEDAKLAAKYGADGIGLFRTEFLFMGDRSPTLKEQESLYSRVISIMKSKPVTVRMLDVGGDKKITYLRLAKEENPFLGYRGIRLYADYLPLIKEQITALLSASACGPVKIMVPMLTSISEITWFKNLVKETEQTLRSEGKTVGTYSIGIMTETPAAGILSNVLAHEVDFFSIGSNDLVQYVLAVDRGGKSVAHLYEPFHPAVLRLIHKNIHYANKAGIEVSLCGDMGGNTQAVPLLVAFGIDAVSTGPSNIPVIKDLIRKLSYQEISQAVASLRTIGTQKESLEFARQFSETYAQ